MKRVAFLSFDWDYEIMSDYYEGMQDSLNAFGDVQLVIFDAFGEKNSYMPERGSSDLFSLCDPSRYDAFIIQGNRSWPPEMRQEVADRICATGKPLISINYRLEGAVTVGTDNYAAMFGLVKRVIQDRGCTHPAFVNGLASSWEARERVRAFGDACAACGVNRMRFYSAAWQMEEGERVAREILSYSGELPDAVFCCNDDLAVGVQEVFLDQGIRVPEDVLIAGFDNRVISVQATPRITTVDRGYRAIGALALKTVVDCLEKRKVARFVPSEASYVLAESCGYALDSESDDEASTSGRGDDAQLRAFDEDVPAKPSFAEEGTPLDVLLEGAQQLEVLRCAGTHVTVNENYLESGPRRSFLPYGDHSLLVSHRDGEEQGEPAGAHDLVSFDAHAVLPPEVPMDGPLYMVFPLWQGTASIGTVVTEGVSPLLKDGRLTSFLSKLSASVEHARLRKLR